MQEVATQPFDELSDIYFRDPYSSISIKRAERVLSLLKIMDFESKRVLDLGCGCGLGTKELANNDRNAIGIDISQSSLNKAKLSATNGSSPLYIRGDMRSLGFTNESFDLVVSLFDSINYVNYEDLNIIVNESRRILKTDGIVALNFLTPLSFGDSSTNPDSIFALEDFYYLSRVTNHIANDVQLELTAFVKEEVGPTYRMLRENHILHLFERKEVVEIVVKHNFKVIGIFDGETSETSSNDSWHVILIARKT